MSDPQRRPSVLVVDADEDTLELVGEYLRARGMEVLTAYAPEEAIALVRSMPVDAVFSEVGEGASGLPLIHAARGRARPAAVVVTLLRESADLAVAAMKAGASDVLRKPYRLRSVHAALQDALGQRAELLRTRAAAERLLFYEAAADLTDLSELARLYGLLAQVARSVCAADEVAVWRSGPTGWSAVARGGRVHVLETLDLQEVSTSGLVSSELMAARPLVGRDGTIHAVVAVAGGRARVPEDLRHLGRLSRLVVDAIERVERGPR